MQGLLIDANISYRIKKLLGDNFSSIEHIASHTLHPLNDYQVWEYAKLHDLTIVTFDEDFVEIQTFKGFPPKIIWLRFGNQPTVSIANKILLNLNSIEQLIEAEELGVLEIY